MKDIAEKDVAALWHIVNQAAKNQLSLGETIDTQKSLNDNAFVKDFFNALNIEIGLDDYERKFFKYLNYIEIIKSKFANRFEFGGGRQFRFYHSLYVANLSSKIAESLNLRERERDIIILSALFHDIGKSIEAFKYVDERGFDEYEIIYATGRHEDIGVDIARDIFSNSGLDKNSMELILQSISYKNSGSIYENILHEADNIAEIGLMGIWRFFYFKACENKDISGLKKFWFNKIRDIKLSNLDKCKFDVGRRVMKSNIEIVDWVLRTVIK